MTLLSNLPKQLPEELTTVLQEGDGVRIERIVSTGHRSPEGFWYGQSDNEWVMVLAGAAKLQFEDRAVELLPGDTITREDVMAQTAITYPQTTVTTMSGDTIKAVLEDVADNLFHPDPYYRQGGDMVRVGGLSFACAPGADRGDRIRDLRLGDEALAPGRRYKVAGWAPVSEGVSGPPVWEVVETYLRARSSLPVPLVNQPRLIGVAGNPGFSDAD